MVAVSECRGISTSESLVHCLWSLSPNFLNMVTICHFDVLVLILEGFHELRMHFHTSAINH